jgi:prepilin-type N-terminal cleavage/methylation domain-containing protein
MRRGFSLMELVVAMAILAVITPLALRLLFTSDRALGTSEAQAQAAGGQAQLLEDLARDINKASSASVQDGWLTLSAAGQRVTYSWVPRSQATVRTVIAPGGETRLYAGVQASFTLQGKLIAAQVQGTAEGLRTAFAMRNQ